MKLPFNKVPNFKALGSGRSSDDARISSHPAFVEMKSSRSKLTQVHWNQWGSADKQGAIAELEMAGELRLSTTGLYSDCETLKRQVLPAMVPA
ncbi:hypothetical protein N7468_009669 [Penicillium chermesinum]|uniref:Uncharacterized protein n=1 Tax=Penicillium chermesinum TaxID=63820 RepID=A0A9W9NI88_9EURO|nr:uncharacterized protein N7468_009669 [Penicillium chermesinum]KAJ5220465.1 hypothetical protein N7468_009669 [Penicillium chermesinum]